MNTSNTENNLSTVKNKIFTIPNFLTLVRILLIPVFIYYYSYKEEYLFSTIILLFSGLTDIVDGYIARKFNLITNLGKILDPIADKLTQAAVLFCLIARFPFMLGLFILLIIKDFFLGIMGLIFIKKNKIVTGSVWHGKVAAVSLYLMMIIHIIWFDIPQSFSNLLILISLVMMLLSLILYARYYIYLSLKINENKNAE